MITNISNLIYHYSIYPVCYYIRYIIISNILLYPIYHYIQCITISNISLNPICHYIKFTELEYWTNRIHSMTYTQYPYVYNIETILYLYISYIYIHTCVYQYISLILIYPYISNNECFHTCGLYIYIIIYHLKLNPIYHYNKYVIGISSIP